MLRIAILIPLIVLCFSSSLLAQPGIANFILDDDNITLGHNTNQGFFQITGHLQDYNIDLIDYYGNVKQNLNSNSSLVIVQMNSLQSGVYFIRLENINNGKIRLEKIVTIQSDAITMIGGWKLVEWFDDIPRDINDDGTASTDLLSQWNGCTKQSILELGNNQIGKIYYTGEPNNPRCPTNFQTNDYFNTPPWDVDFLGLNFIGSDFIDSYEIIELSSDVLILRGSSFMTCCDPNISYYGGFLKFERVYY